MLVVNKIISIWGLVEKCIICINVLFRSCLCTLAANRPRLVWRSTIYNLHSIWNKINKSSKTGQGKKSLISSFAWPSTGIIKVLFLEGRQGEMLWGYRGCWDWGLVGGLDRVFVAGQGVLWNWARQENTFVWF